MFAHRKQAFSLDDKAGRKACFSLPPLMPSEYSLHLYFVLELMKQVPMLVLGKAKAAQLKLHHR
jgi:hypothetical protein